MSILIVILWLGSSSAGDIFIRYSMGRRSVCTDKLRVDISVACVGVIV